MPPKLATVIAMRAALLPDGRIAVEVMRARDASPQQLRDALCALVEGLEQMVPTLIPGPAEGQPMN